MTTHRDLTTPEEVLAALRAGEMVEAARGADPYWVTVQSADAQDTKSFMLAGHRYRAVTRLRTFTAAEVAEACEKVAQEWRDECDRLNGGRHRPFTSEENSVRALALAGCADELHERITHWLRENEG